MIKNIPYRIEKIETRQFAIFPEELISGKDHDLDISATFNFSISPDISHIRFTAHIRYEQQ